MPLLEPALTKTISIDYLLRPLGGASGSVLASTADGLFVIKSRRNHLGPNLLANELLGTELMRAVGLPVPEWCFARYGLAYSPKLFFASRYLRAPSGRLAFEVLPTSLIGHVANRSDLIGALVFDLWAGSTDVRQAIFVQRSGSDLYEVVFIDQGHLFGGPHWRTSASSVQTCLDPALYGCEMRDKVLSWVKTLQLILPPALREIVPMIPGSWYRGDLKRLIARLNTRLQDLGTLALEQLVDNGSIARASLATPRCLQTLLLQGCGHGMEQDALFEGTLDCASVMPLQEQSENVLDPSIREHRHLVLS